MSGFGFLPGIWVENHGQRARFDTLESTRKRVMKDFDDEFKEIQKRMERVIRDLFPNRFFHMPGEAWNPPVDVYETEKDLVIIADLAGVVPESLRISFEIGVLKISGRRESFANASHTKCHQIEIDFGSFQKEIHIPFALEANSATSQYKAGLLKIRLPKEG